MIEEWLVLVGRIWHRVQSQQHRLTVCDRSYEPDSRVEHRAPELGDVVCPGCFEAQISTPQ